MLGIAQFVHFSINNFFVSFSSILAHTSAKSELKLGKISKKKIRRRLVIIDDGADIYH